MKKPPRDSKDGIFAGGVAYDIAYQGLFVTILVLISYFVGHFMQSGMWEIAQSEDGMTMAFLTMSMAEIFQSFNMRSRRGSLFTLKKQNVMLWGAAALALLLTTAVIYVPFLKNLFGFTEISLAEYGVALAISVLIIPLVELVKLFQRMVAKAKNK